MSGKCRAKYLLCMVLLFQICKKTNRMKTGEKIKELRIKKSMTQEDLADKTDLSVRTIQRIENGEVDPRMYTLSVIAKALETEVEEFNENTEHIKQQKIKSENQKWFALMHLSGIGCFLLPPIILWIWKKDSIEGLNEHAVKVINFQLSMWVYLFSSTILIIFIIGIPLLIALGMFSSVLILFNTLKTLSKQETNYPFSIRFLKSL